MSSLKASNPPGGPPPPLTPRPEYWRSLAELEGSPELRELLAHEWPAAVEDEPIGSPARRRFMTLMGASFALAGVAGCRWEEQKIVPLTRRPEGMIPGVPRHFATSMELGGVSVGLLARSYDGRPIKIEGNPAHPDSRGACGVYHQAGVLELYDPDRSASPARFEGGRRTPASWADFETFARTHFDAAKKAGGRGLAVLAGSSASPTLLALKRKLLAGFPQARWFEWEAVSRDNEREGARLAFGKPLRALLSLDRAKVVVALDADLFGCGHPAALRLARDFAQSRRPETGQMSRLYVLESSYSPTGGVADHRLPLRSELIKAVAAWLDATLSQKLAPPVDLGRAQPAPAAAFLSDPKVQKLLDAMVKDLVQARAAGVVVAGAAQPPEVHALCHRINAVLGSVGTVVGYVDEPEPERPTHRAAIQSLAAAMNAGQVETLVVLGGNPVYDAPADVGFEAALARVKTSVHLALHEDETSRRSSWHVPAAHWLEAWGDGQGWDGTLTFQQPLIAPLYGGRSAIELVALIVGDPVRKGLELIKRTHAERFASERLWKKAIHDGLLAGSEAPRATPRPRELPALQLSARELGGLDAPEELEISFAPCLKVYDGRFANNGWLQELPDFVSKLTWDNAALISPKTAEKLGVADGTLVRLSLGARQIELPALMTPGQAAGSVRVVLGYGRTAAGRIAGSEQENVAPVGANAYALREAASLDFAGGLRVTPTGRKAFLASVQDKHAIDAAARAAVDERVPELIREASLKHFQEKPDFPRHAVHHYPLLSLWQEPVAYEGHRWGISIDLGRCTGCSACIVACVAENNTPIVGKERVAMGREMHWLRVDRYYRGDPEDPTIAHQPVMCHQCDHAPCEQVCPVGATMHTHEGLNDMVYNRCIGTRYCSNNCPYKVRRFNYFNFHEDLKDARNDTKKMVFNPEVTIRFRGVMEKCTFCVQRIQNVKIAAKNARRPIADGEIQTACQQTCPTGAIVFGDLNDPKSRVTELQNRPRSYAMLAELNVRPRLQYLARVRNPHPDLDADGGAHPAASKPAEHG